MGFDFSQVDRDDLVPLATRAKPGLPDVSMTCGKMGRGTKLHISLAAAIAEPFGPFRLAILHNRKHDVLIISPRDDGVPSRKVKGGRVIISLDIGDFVPVEDRQTPEYQLDAAKPELMIRVPPAYRGSTPARLIKADAPPQLPQSPQEDDASGLRLTQAEKLVLKMLMRAADMSAALDTFPGVLGLHADDVNKLLRNLNLKLGARKASIVIKAGQLTLTGAEKLVGVV